MIHDIRPSLRRSWAERHPVLFEALGILGAVALVAAVTALALYVVSEEPETPPLWHQVLAAHDCKAVPRLSNPLRREYTIYECADGTRVGP